MKDRMALIDEANRKKMEAAEECERRKEMLKKSFVPQRCAGSKLNKVWRKNGVENCFKLFILLD